jgi:hypothetical protein
MMSLIHDDRLELLGIVEIDSILVLQALPGSHDTEGLSKKHYIGTKTDSHVVTTTGSAASLLDPNLESIGKMFSQTFSRLVGQCDARNYDEDGVHVIPWLDHRDKRRKHYGFPGSWRRRHSGTRESSFHRSQYGDYTVVLIVT